MTRKAKEEKGLEAKKDKGKASAIKNKVISKAKESTKKTSESKEFKPKVTKSKKVTAVAVAKKSPKKINPAKATPSKRALNMVASDAMYEPKKKDKASEGTASVQRHKASKVAAR